MMMFISMSVYFMIYTSFNLLLITMVQSNHSNVSNDIFYANVGKRYPWPNYQQLQALNVFHVGEAISAIPSGILVEMRGPKLITSLGIGLAGAISFVIPFAARVGISFVCLWRLLQGFFCSEVMLGCHFLISRWSPRQEQCKIVWCFLGSMMGSAYTALLTVTLLEHFRDYYIVFYVTGSLSIAWSVIWFLIITDNPKEHSQISNKELKYILKTVEPVLDNKFHFISFQSVFASKRFWALMILQVSHEYGLFTVLTLAPKFFEEFFHKMSLWQVFFPQLCRLFFALICAIIMDLLTKWNIKHFGRTEHVKAFVMLSHIMPALLLCLIHVVNFEYKGTYAVYVSCLTFMGAATVTNLNLIHDLAPNHSSQIAGYSRCMGLVSAVFIRHISAQIKANKGPSEAWNIIFFLTAGIYVIASILYMCLGSSKLQKWNFHPSSYKFADCDTRRTRTTNIMELLRKLSVIVHKQETDSSEQDFHASSDGLKLPRKITKEFENFGLTWLHSIAPCFSLDGNKISIIHEPTTFYNMIMEKCRTAKRRITLASLYLGTGHLEEQLITAIGENLKSSKGQLKVKVLLDYTRGSRGENNSRCMLLPLVSQYKDLCQVSLYHTPALRGPLRTIMPQRYNEVIGLQHMKVYLFDDSLLISGANLSNDYFTNRQDRYVLIENCENLANFYDGLVSRVSEFSLQLKKNDQVHLHPDWEWHPYKGEKQEFESAARDKVWTYYSSSICQHENLDKGDTWIFPLVEMGQLGLHQDSYVTKRLFQTALPGSMIHLATGYFNLTQEYITTMIHHSSATYNILMAHPTANGFMGARGPAGGIPAAYTLLASAFFKQLQASSQEQRVQMAEFQKKGWTYHAKGLWYTLPGHRLPIMTFVGSPNFGNRSVGRDLETQIAIVTKNPQLQQKLLEERERLYKSGTPFSSETLSEPERKNAPLWVHVAVRVFRGLL